MNISDLNGEWEVVLTSNIHEIMPNYYDFTNATIVLTDGKFVGSDSGGISWKGVFELAPQGHSHDILVWAQMDPRSGIPGAVVMHHDGQLKREPVNHEAALKLTKAENSVRLKGTVNIGPIIVNFVIRPI